MYNMCVYLHTYIYACIYKIYLKVIKTLGTRGVMSLSYRLITVHVNVQFFS